MAKLNPDTPTPTAAAAVTPTPTAADPEAGEWQVDSASAAIGLAPEDTTAGAPTASGDVTPVVAAAAVADEAPVVDEPPADGTAAEGPTAGEEPAPVAAAPTPADGKPKKKAPIARREAALTKDIDRLTYQKRTLEADLQKEQARLEQLRLDAVALEKKSSTVSAPAPGAAAPVTDPPAHPNYKDFETDAEYEAAVQKWKTVDLPAWQQQRDEARAIAHRAELEAIKTDIQKGLETRLGTAEQEAQVAARIEQAKQAHPDWADHVPHLKDLTSPWRKDDSHGPTPFLTDVVRSSAEGGEVLYWLASHPEEAEILASLQPTRALRDAVVLSPSPRALFEHFATETGQHEWEQLAREAHPGRVLVAVGALSERLAAAPRGSASPAPSPITAAVPSAKPPVGSPRARPAVPAGSGSAMPPFDEWMAQEDARERAERLRAMGLPVPA